MFKQDLVFKVSTFFPVIPQDNVFLRKLRDNTFFLEIPKTAAIHLIRRGRQFFLVDSYF